VGLFRRTTQPPPPSPTVDDAEERSFALSQMGRWISDFVSPTTGRYVSVDEAMRWSAAWACVRVLGQSASMLPIDSVRYVDGARVPIVPKPSLLVQPSELVESDVWVFQLIESMEADGNAWGLISSTDRRGYPTTIETLDPSTLQDRKVEGGIIQASLNGEVHKRYPYGDLWHVPGVFVRAGSPFGLSTVAYAAGTIDAALAAEQFGARFMTEGAHPSAIISADTQLSDVQAAGIKAAFLNAIGGSREPAVMGSGLTYTPIQINPEDSQFLDLLRLEVENTCRFFGVPPTMVYGSVSGQSVTYANVAQADLAYLKHSLDGRLVRLERALSKLLPGGQTVKFNRDALLRADATTRWQVHTAALAAKARSVNEVRRIEDEAPFDDPIYDEPGIPGSGDAPTMPADPADDPQEPTT
jgi:HK97 family phage portal protein